MPALQVRELPEDIYVQLKRCASENHRSIAQQTTTLIEEGLARRGYAAGEATTQGAPISDGVSASGDIPIPRCVKEASERARFVDPFGWASCLEVEPEEVVAARREKRRKLREMIASFEWSGPAPTLEETVAMIREDRDTRGNVIIENVTLYLQDKESR